MISCFLYIRVFFPNDINALSVTTLQLDKQPYNILLWPNILTYIHTYSNNISDKPTVDTEYSVGCFIF